MNKLPPSRDQEILDLLAHGKRDKQIAAYLEVHEGTLRTAINRIMFKMGAKTRCQAVAIHVEKTLWPIKP